jgi:hypothetical protein
MPNEMILTATIGDKTTTFKVVEGQNFVGRALEGRFVKE